MQSLFKIKGHIGVMFAFFKEATELEALHWD